MNKLFPHKYSRVPGYIELHSPATTLKTGRFVDMDSGQIFWNSSVALSEFRAKDI